MIASLLLVAALFALGVYLSAFFSGSETAYYRLSPIRVMVEAEGGDKPSRRLLTFLRDPAGFVATVLIGNNVANYLVTVASGMTLSLLFANPGDLAEVLLTLCVTPVVFLFGELVPKNTNYLMPLRSLRGKVNLFRAFYYAFFVMSWPLVQLTRLLERLTGGNDADVKTVLGRPQIGDLVAQGQSGGVLTDAQAAMTSRLLSVGAETVGTAVGESPFEFGMPVGSTRRQLLDHAARYGLTDIPLHADGTPGDWVAGVSIGTLLKSEKSPRSLSGPLPRVSAAATKLSAVRRIREARSGYAVVESQGRVVGLVSLSALLQDLLRDPPRSDR